MPLTITEVVAIITALGLGAVIQALINAWLNRRKIDAEAILTEKECEKTQVEIEKENANVEKTKAEFVEIFQRAYKNLLDELNQKIQKQDERIIALEAGEVMKNDQILYLQQALLVKDRQIAMLEAEVADLRKIIYDLTGKKPPRKRIAERVPENG